MRLSGPSTLFKFVTAVALGLLVAPMIWAQDAGDGDLDKAFALKLEAKSTKDLDQVVKLCESAIEKGLGKDSVREAEQLAASALFEHAEQLGQRIFATGAQDRRWRVYRSQALSRLRKAVKFQPELSDAFLLMVRLNALPGGNKEDAKEAIDKVLAITGQDDATKSKAYFYRATMQEDPNEQLNDLNEAIKANPGNMDAVRTRAAYYLRRREPNKAIADLNAWLDTDEKNTQNHIAVVQQLMDMGEQFDDELQAESLKIINKAIEMDPENPEPLTVRARLRIFQDKTDEAIEDATKALKLDQGNVSALMIRASLFAEKEKLDEALEDVNLVLEKIPRAERAIRMRGIILSQKGDFEGAIEDIKLLSLNSPSDQFYQRQLAMLYNANDEPRKAIRIYNRLLRENADGSWDGQPSASQLLLMQRRASSLRGRGDARLSTGEHAGAIEDYDEALELGGKIRSLEDEEGLELTPIDDGVLNNLAWVLATSPKDDLRDGERAVNLAKQAAELTEFKEAHILSTLASGYAESGDFEKAIEWVEKALEVNKEVGEQAVDKTRTNEQKESLGKELESYKQKKPWRELQDVEKEKAEAAEKAAAEDADEEKEDSADEEESDADEGDNESDKGESNGEEGDGDK